MSFTAFICLFSLIYLLDFTCFTALDVFFLLFFIDVICIYIKDQMFDALIYVLGPRF